MHRPQLRHRLSAFVELLYGNTLALVIFLLIGLVSPHLLRQKTVADWLAEAMAKSHQKDWAGSISDLTEALKLDPQSGVIYLRRGAARMMQGDLKHSSEDFTSAIEYDPRLSLAFFGRATARIGLGNQTGALADYDDALKLDPDLDGVLSSRGLLKFKMGDTSGALADLNHAIRVNPGKSEHFYNRGLIHDRRREYHEAIADYLQATTLQPDNPGVLNNLAWMCATSPGLGDSDRAQALKYATQACTLTHWENAPYLDTLAAAYAAVGQYDDAIKWQLKYVEMAPDEPGGKARLDLYQKHQPYLEAL